MTRRGFVGWTPETERAARPVPMFHGVDYSDALRGDWIPAAPMTPMERRTQLISHEEAEQRQINDYLSRGYKVLFDLRTEEGARSYQWESRLRSIKRLLYVKEDVETSALLSVGYWVTER